jgi:hypothetical protein
MFGDVGAFKDVTEPIWTSGNEEINFERAGSPGGRNYGWRVMEGTFFAPPSGQEPGDLPPNDPSFTPPTYEYLYGGNYADGGGATFTGRSVTGGNVYRGPVTELWGKYIFADWSSHQVWMLEFDRDANGGLGGVVPGSLVDLSTLFNRQTAVGTGPLEGVTAFGEDAAGNLYYVELGGELYKIVGDVDGDYSDDMKVDGDDLVFWQAAFGPGDNSADADGDGDSDGDDFLVWQRQLGVGVAAAASASPAPEPASAALLLTLAVALPAVRRQARECRNSQCAAFPKDGK